ncbi:MAG: bifunctional 4-hydroxy-2-oxoglutarate aldolase/2-dehydro-3-deoxy-phosphogluconate aldolase [Fibromonadales bacterium]|nr:bifunctional 4-hydroxy-2-oxoglutarate aldolase/2-dehydro-3-deoxy-phosphogluconate aldolase [Fibromonadales bacterium]
MNSVLNSVFLEEFRKSPFLGIARGLPPKQVSNCVEACLKANLKFIEVPLNTENAALALKNLCKEGKKKGLVVGAGTVITERNLQIAIDCEAKFIVSPGANPALVQKCAEKSIPCIPGALTPTEIMQAFMLGATAIKVFPVSSLGGEKYIKELRGPFKEIPLLACGGVKEDNIKAYFEAGSDFVSFGASVFTVSEMESGNWQEIEKKLSRLLSLAAPLFQ